MNGGWVGACLPRWNGAMLCRACRDRQRNLSEYERQLEHRSLHLKFLIPVLLLFYFMLFVDRIMICLGVGSHRTSSGPETAQLS